MNGYIFINGWVFNYLEHNILKGQIIELWLSGEIKILDIKFKEFNKQYRSYIV